MILRKYHEREVGNSCVSLLLYNETECPSVYVLYTVSNVLVLFYSLICI